MRDAGFHFGRVAVRCQWQLQRLSRRQVKRWESSNIGIDERLGTGEETVETRGETAATIRKSYAISPAKG